MVRETLSMENELTVAYTQNCETLSIVQIRGKAQGILFGSGGDQGQLNSKSIYLQTNPNLLVPTIKLNKF